jgi:hypothetical protein
MAQLVIVCKVVSQCLEPTDGSERFAAEGHDRSERKIHLVEAARLKDLRPKISIHGDGFQTHPEIGRTDLCIQAARQSGRWVSEFQRDCGQKLFGRADVGIADDEEIMLGQSGELNKSGYLRVCAKAFRANDQFGVAHRIFLNEPAHQIHNRI